MKNITAKVITKKLHGWLDDRAKHVPLPPLPDEILAKAVFQVPDSWVPVYAVSFDCDKGEEPAPDAWLKPDGQIVRNQNLLAEHAKTFGMPEGFLALYFGDAEQDAVDGACQCIGCRLNRFLAGLRATVDDAIANERDEIAEQTRTENAIFEGLFDSADRDPLSVSEDGKADAFSDLLIVAEHAQLLVNLLDEHFEELPQKFKDLLTIPLNDLEDMIEIHAQEYLDGRATVELVTPEPVIPAEVPFADGDSMAEALQEELGIARQAALYSIHQMKESRARLKRALALPAIWLNPRALRQAGCQPPLPTLKNL